jgi:hypothetical protein
VPDRLLRGSILVLAVLVGLGAAVAWQAPPRAFTAAAAAYAAAHLVAVPTRTGRHLSFAPAVVAVIAYLSGGSPVMVFGAAGVGLPFALLIVHVRFGRRAVDDTFPAELVGLILYGAVVSSGTLVLSAPSYQDLLTVALYGLAAVGWFAATTVVRAVASQQGRHSVRRLVMVRGVDDWASFAAIFASAALFAMTVGILGPWSVPLAGLPYAFSHTSLSRLQATDRTYRETMLALSRIPEAGGLVPTGHAERCAELSVTLGAELGMSGPALRRVEQAALLHDIGKVVLANPVLAAGGYDQSDVAVWSSAIIGEARYLEPVAGIVASQYQPYRRPGESRDESTPLESQVLRAVAAYDGELQEGASPTDSLERLHRGAAYDYDPEVVAALRRVLQRHGVIAA